MKTIILSFLLLFFFQSSFAQYLPPNNLVVNPHFNNYTYHIIPNYYDVCPYPRIRCGYQNPTSLMYHALCLENWIKPTMGHSGWVHHDSCDYYGYPLPPLAGKGISLVHLVNI
jgi:hypothetical protein